jgi:hypothetical protein
MLFVSNIPKPNPKENEAPITEYKEFPLLIKNKAGTVKDKPIALVYTLPLIFFCDHLSDKMPPKMTPKREDAASVMVDIGPATLISICKF